jgi:hypothetical protein
VTVLWAGEVVPGMQGTVLQDDRGNLAGYLRTPFPTTWETLPKPVNVHNGIRHSWGGQTPQGVYDPARWIGFVCDGPGDQTACTLAFVQNHLIALARQIQLMWDTTWTLEKLAWILWDRDASDAAKVALDKALDGLHREPSDPQWAWARCAVGELPVPPHPQLFSESVWIGLSNNK